MNRTAQIILFPFVVLGGVLAFVARNRLSKMPISLAMAQTSTGKNGCELVLAVDRRDPIVGLRHGATPTLERAWLSDGQGNELPASLLSLLNELPPNFSNSSQFGWIVSATIPDAPENVVFHATFVASGAAPFNFDQPLHAGINFNVQN